MHCVRICAIPSGRMVSSGVGMFGEENFDRFMAFLRAQPPDVAPRDYLFWDDSGERQGFHWLYRPTAATVIPPELAIVDFRGGLYAVATDIDQRTDMAALDAAVERFLAENNLMRDASRPRLGNIITSPEAQEILGYNQMDYYIPVCKNNDTEKAE